MTAQPRAHTFRRLPSAKRAFTSESRVLQALLEGAKLSEPVII